MIVEDIVYIIGRGNIVVCDDVSNVNLNDKFKINGIEFEVYGIEHSSHMKRGGLLLRPNTLVKENINIGDRL